MKRFLLVFLLILANTLSFSQNEATTKDGKKVLLFDDGSWVYANTDTLTIKSVALKNLEIPKLKPNETIVSHLAYTLSYNEEHEQANWVAYQLTKEETISLFERNNNFLIDPKVKTGSANHNDYKDSGYDRGHLAPAADMGWSSTAMAESFYFSNMSPQNPSFNRGIWKRLEELVRTWAVEHESVYVVTAPILSSGLPSIGQNNVSVPKLFYKVILDYTEPSIKGIGFIIPNASSTEPLQAYAVTIDKVEGLTGIDFFPELPDDQENNIESTLNINDWTWKSTNTNSIKSQATNSMQCKGTTKKGSRCKNMTHNDSGFCHQHS